VLAAQGLGLDVQHLGSTLGRPGVACYVDVSDQDVARLYQRSRYVSGLRRIEGFELPAAEGLLCGARPILFDRPHYRKWYGDLAVYIPEEPRPQAQASIADVLAGPYRCVTAEERDAAAAWFSWERVCRGFWEQIA
jgi:glycosyltransferase involved in cell wall biosynthesis